MSEGIMNQGKYQSDGGKGEPLKDQGKVECNGGAGQELTSSSSIERNPGADYEPVNAPQNQRKLYRRTRPCVFGVSVDTEGALRTVKRMDAPIQGQPNETASVSEIMERHRSAGRPVEDVALPTIHPTRQEMAERDALNSHEENKSERLTGLPVPGSLTEDDPEAGYNDAHIPEPEALNGPNANTISTRASEHTKGEDDLDPRFAEEPPLDDQTDYPGKGKALGQLAASRIYKALATGDLNSVRDMVPARAKGNEARLYLSQLNARLEAGMPIAKGDGNSARMEQVIEKPVEDDEHYEPSPDQRGVETEKRQRLLGRVKDALRTGSISSDLAPIVKAAGAKTGEESMRVLAALADRLSRESKQTGIVPSKDKGTNQEPGGKDAPSFKHEGEDDVPEVRGEKVENETAPVEQPEHNMLSPALKSVNAGRGPGGQGAHQGGTPKSKLSVNWGTKANKPPGTR
jgi:hypothetical protein